MMKNILVIDDDYAVRDSFQLALESFDCTVRVAEDGLQGIELAKAARPDLIFLDLKMPGIDGVETMRRLLAFDKSLKIYIVTAFSLEYLTDLTAAQAEGMVFELASKPLASKQIRQIVSAMNSIQVINKSDNKIALTLYVMTMTPESQQFITKMKEELAAGYLPGCWTLDVVEVLSMPGKALEKNVFATPMLVRDIPEPVFKLLGELSNIDSMLATLIAQNADESATVML
jgi:CheY-like chemotaxis protein